MQHPRVFSAIQDIQSLNPILVVRSCTFLQLIFQVLPLRFCDPLLHPLTGMNSLLVFSTLVEYFLGGLLGRMLGCRWRHQSGLKFGWVVDQVTEIFDFVINTEIVAFRKNYRVQLRYEQISFFFFETDQFPTYFLCKIAKITYFLC